LWQVVSVTAGDGAGYGALFDDLYHFGLLEPHKRFQNSVSIFQKRKSDHAPCLSGSEPLYSWTP